MEIFQQEPDHFEFAVAKQGVIEVVCESYDDAFALAESGDVIIRISGMIEKKLVDIPYGKYFKTVKASRKLQVNGRE